MLKIVIWDKANNMSLAEFSNAPLGCLIEIDLEDATMKLAHKARLYSVADITDGDVFEIRVIRI